MTSARLFLGAIGIFFLAATAFADSTVILTPGQSYKSGGNTVVCTDGENAAPIAVTECQYWDEFNKKCLFEATRYVLPGMQCLANCQHWDNFFKRCNFAVSCKYMPKQGVFLQTTCVDYDDFNKKCLRQEQKIITQGNQGERRHSER